MHIAGSGITRVRRLFVLSAYSSFCTRYSWLRTGRVRRSRLVHRTPRHLSRQGPEPWRTQQSISVTRIFGFHDFLSRLSRRLPPVTQGETLLTSATPGWRNPMLNLHQRHVGKKLARAATAAAELGAPFDAEMVREALRYERWTFLRRLRRVGYVFGAMAIFGAVLYKPACTPGGRLSLSPAECSSVFAYYDLGAPTTFFTLMGSTLLILWIRSVWKGEYIAKGYELLYPLLDLLVMATAVATRQGSGYIDAAKLADKTTDLRQGFWQLPVDVAKEFGHVGDIREQVGNHAARVFAVLEADAAGLAAERREAARNLGLHVAQVISNLTAGHFTSLLDDQLPDSEPDADQLAGRYLVRACVKSALLVVALCFAGTGLGLSAIGVLVGSLPTFFLVTYLILVHKHGLAEASRLLYMMKQSVGGPSEASPAAETPPTTDAEHP